MTGLRVKDAFRLREGEPGGVEAIPSAVVVDTQDALCTFS